MKKCTDIKAYEDHYIVHKRQQCDQILNCPNLISAFQKEAFKRKWKTVSSKEKVTDAASSKGKNQSPV